MSNAGGMATIQRYTDMLAGNTTWSPWEPDGAFDALATVTVGATSVASIEFAGIPQGYKHLQIRALQITSFNAVDPKFQVNNDTGANYYMHSIYNTNPTVSTYNQATTSISYCYNESSFPGVAIIDLLDYSSTTKNKTFRMMTGYDANGSGYLFYRSGAWFNTSAVTSLKFNAAGQNFQQYTQYSLYGVK
jgi:hypothetical protein